MKTTSAFYISQKNEYERIQRLFSFLIDIFNYHGGFAHYKISFKTIGGPINI